MGYSGLVFAQYVGWLTGYVTGFDTAAGSGVYKDTDISAMLVYMDNYCQKNPLEPFMHGARLLVLDLRLPSPEE